MYEKERCFHHENNKRLREEKGFINGGCVIRWDIECGGRPDLVFGGHQCPGYYIPIEAIDRANGDISETTNSR